MLSVILAEMYVIHGRYDVREFLCRLPCDFLIFLFSPVAELLNCPYEALYTMASFILLIVGCCSMLGQRGVGNIRFGRRS